MVFTDFQYDLIEIENQITNIITGNIEIHDWNQMQIKKIPELLYKATEHNKRLGKELDVIVQNFRNLERDLVSWKQDYPKFLSDHDLSLIHI